MTDAPIDEEHPAVAQMRRHELDHDVPWALPIVVRRSKTDIAAHQDVVAAVAEAVVTFLDDPRSQPEGPWHEAVAYWRDGAIRKVVRRGDGKQFEDAAALDGIRLIREGREGYGLVDVLVLPPGPVQPLPRELKKLQVGGTEFPHAEDAADGSDPVSRESAALDPAAARDPSTPLVTIELSPEVELTTGKAAAQCAHAAQLVYEQMPADRRDAWRDAGFRVRVVTPDRAVWASTDAPVRVIDAGFTEVDGPTETARGRW